MSFRSKIKESTFQYDLLIAQKPEFIGLLEENKLFVAENSVNTLNNFKEEQKEKDNEENQLNHDFKNFKLELGLPLKLTIEDLNNIIGGKEAFKNYLNALLEVDEEEEEDWN